MVHSDPNKSQAVREEFDRLAHRYDARWSHYVRASVRGTLSRVQLRPGMSLLDIGCGTGALLREVEDTMTEVRTIGMDLSAKMLAVARSRLPPPTGLSRADVHDLPFASRSFDIVVSTSSLHFWSDPPHALREIGRVLTPRGRLVLTDWCDDYLTCRICDRVLRIVNRAHQRIYRRDECEALLREAGYEVELLERYKIDWLWGLMTARAAR